MSDATTSTVPAPMRLGRRVVLLAGLGACLGPLLDGLHVYTGAIFYIGRPDGPFGPPLWVPPLYAGAALGIGLSHPSLDGRLGRTSRRGQSTAGLISGVLGMAAIWFASGLLASHAAWAHLVLGPAALALFWSLDRTPQGLALALLTAAGGVTVEFTLLSAGLFAYHHPDVGPLASWLPWLYVGGSVAIGNLGRRLTLGGLS